MFLEAGIIIIGPDFSLNWRNRCQTACQTTRQQKLITHSTKIGQWTLDVLWSLHHSRPYFPHCLSLPPLLLWISLSLLISTSLQCIAFNLFHFWVTFLKTSNQTRFTSHHIRSPITTKSNKFRHDWLNSFHLAFHLQRQTDFQSWLIGVHQYTQILW